MGQTNGGARMMNPSYRIESQYFDEKYEMGVLIQIKEIATGKLFCKTPIALFNDLELLEKFSTSDIRLIGYMVGDYQMYQSQKLIRENTNWPRSVKPN